MGHPDWQAHAACRDLHPDVFFDGPLGRARAVCATCTVKADCLAYALHDPSLLGVWGGTSERQRRRMRRSGTTTDRVGQGATQTATVPTAGQVPSGYRYRGVRLWPSGRYSARVSGISLGRYDTADEAADACERLRQRLRPLADQYRTTSDHSEPPDTT